MKKLELVVIVKHGTNEIVRMAPSNMNQSTEREQPSDEELDVVTCVEISRSQVKNQ